jgi:predicted GNAT family acetyltransferase
MAQGVYALGEVRPVPRAPGRPRLATEQDGPAVRRLVDAVAEETDLDVVRDRTRHTVDARLGSSPDRGGFWLWEVDGDVVSISGHGMPTPTGIRIGPVYTPTERRGLGYATSLVAEQAAWLLAQGWSFCFLYTDLANPTSNGVYRRVGYEQVAEAVDIGFDAAGASRSPAARAPGPSGS